MDEQTIVKSSIIEIFNDHGYKDLTNMTQRDFDHIGEQLRQKTGILISGTTIKRLAYGEFSRLPQIATLNAIANYFNYKTWQDYKAGKIRNGEAKAPAKAPVNELGKEPANELGKAPVNELRKEPASELVKERANEVTNEPAKKATHRSGLKYLSIAGILIILAGIYFLGTNKGTVKNAETATFSFRRNTSNDIPNSVVFNYNIDNVQADSFFIQQSWDENRRVRIYKGKYTVTDIYYEPGYHIARLIANDSAIRAVDVSIPTDRWFFYAIDNVARYTPQYIKTDSSADHGSLGLTAAQLLESSIDVNKDKRYHYVYFPSQMNVPGDHFEFKTRVRMKEVRPTPCPYIELELYCQRSFIVMRSTTKGCAHEGLIQFGEQVMKGTDTDLLPVSFDVSQWTDITITVKNKVATVKLNDKEVFSTRFVTDTKYLAGLGYISNGLCEIDKAELTGPDGEVMYKSDF